MSLSDGIASANTFLVLATALVALITFLLMRAQWRAVLRAQAPCVHVVAAAIHGGPKTDSNEGQTIVVTIQNTGDRDAERTTIRYAFVPCDETGGGGLDQPILIAASSSAICAIPGVLSSTRHGGVLSRMSFEEPERRGQVVFETSFYDSKAGDRLTSIDYWCREGATSLREENRAEVTAALEPIVRKWPATRPPSA